MRRLILNWTTVMILSFGTDRSGANSEDPDQTAPRGQSDQGLHWLLFHLHLFDKTP